MVGCGIGSLASAAFTIRDAAMPGENPIRDGAVLPVLHLNGYKINNPTLLARIGRDELESLFVGYGYTPYFVEGNEPESMHQAMAATLEHRVLEIRKFQDEARRTGIPTPPRWPIIILRSPRAERPRGRWKDTTWKATGARTRSPCRTSTPAPRSCDCWNNGCAATSRRNYSMRRAGLSRNCGDCRPRGPDA